MIRSGIILLIFFIITSCELVIDIDLPPHRTSLVINSISNIDSTIRVDLTQDKFILEEEFDYTRVPGALVELYLDGNLVEVLQEDDEGLGIYRSIQTMVPGEEYTIEVNKNGFESVSASEVGPLYPASLRIESMDERLSEYGDKLIRLKFGFQDLSGDNFYDLRLYKEEISYVYTDSVEIPNGTVQYDVYFEFVGSQAGEFSDTEDQRLFTDELFANKYHTLAIEFNDYPSYRGEGREDTSIFYLELRNVSENYYRYITSLELQQNTRDNPFAEVAPVHNNVENGFGIFATYAAKRERFEILHND